MSVKRPMWMKLAAVSIALAALPAAAVGIGLININADTLRTDSRDFRLVVAEDIASSFEGELQQAQRTVAATSHILGNPELVGEGRVALLQTLIGLDPSVDHIDIFDKDGLLIDRIAEDGVDLAPPAQSIKPGDKESVMFAANKARLSITVPIRPDSPTGYVVSHIPLNRVQKRAADIAAERMPKGSHVYIVNGANQILVHDDITKTGSTFTPNEVIADITQLVQKHVAASGESQAGTTLTSVKPLSLLNAAVVVDVPLEFAYASLADMRRLVITVTLIAILLAAMAAFVSARLLTRPLERLSEFVRKLAARDFTARTEVSTKDEVGVLAGALNDAAQNLDESEAQIRKEIEIRTDLSRYLSRDLVENVVAREQDMNLGGKHSEITVMFADVVRFTPLCERLEPEIIVSILNELFTMITEIVFKHGGTVDKFIGDCVMAFWGAPREDKHQAAHALAAAEEILSWLEIGNARWMKNHNVKIELAIGVNSGTAIVGNIGSTTRMEYTAVGNCVNIAARLEALARPLQILTTQSTCSQVSGYEFMRMGEEPIGANQGLVEVFEVIL